MSSRRRFIKTTGHAGLLYWLPAKEFVNITDQNNNTPYEFKKIDKKPDPDDLIELAKQILNNYKTLSDSWDKNYSVMEKQKQTASALLDMYNGQNIVSYLINTIYAIYLDNSLYDYDCDIVLTDKNIRKNFIEAFENIGSGDSAENISIMPIKNATSVLYEDAPISNLFVLKSRVYFYYSQNSSWELIIKIPCLFNLSNNSLEPYLFSVPTFYNLGGEQVDPIGKAPAKERRQLRQQLITKIKELFKKFSTEVSFETGSSFKINPTPKNIIVSDCVRILANSTNSIKKTNLRPQPLANSKLKEYLLSINVDLALSIKLIQEVFKQNISLSSIQPSINISQLHRISDNLARLHVTIGIYVQFFDWWIDTASGSATIDTDYDLLVVDHFNYADLIANNYCAYHLHTRVDGFPPGASTDDALNAFEQAIENEFKNYCRVKYSLNPADNLTLFFRSDGITFLKS